jgi:hypothetical protein
MRLNSAKAPVVFIGSEITTTSNPKRNPAKAAVTDHIKILFIYNIYYFY